MAQKIVLFAMALGTRRLTSYNLGVGFRKKSIKILILGKTWTTTFHQPDNYVKNVATDSKHQIDYTVRTIDVDLQYLDEEHMRHELTHAYAKERSLVELQIKTIDQAEEFFCEIAAKHGKTIVEQADTLVKVGRALPWKKTS